MTEAERKAIADLRAFARDEYCECPEIDAAIELIEAQGDVIEGLRAADEEHVQARSDLRDEVRKAPDSTPVGIPMSVGTRAEAERDDQMRDGDELLNCPNCGAATALVLQYENPPIGSGVPFFTGYECRRCGQTYKDEAAVFAAENPEEEDPPPPEASRPS